MRKSFVAVVAALVMLVNVGACSPATVESDTRMQDIPACVNEDGSTADGYQPVCYWDASERGNGMGVSYVLVDGEVVEQW